MKIKVIETKSKCKEKKQIPLSFTDKSSLKIGDLISKTLNNFNINEIVAKSLHEVNISDCVKDSLTNQHNIKPIVKPIVKVLDLRDNSSLKDINIDELVSKTLNEINLNECVEEELNDVNIGEYVKEALNDVNISECVGDALKNQKTIIKPIV